MTAPAQPGLYVVTCDCDGDARLRIIALVDDDRPVGGRVRIEALTTVKRSTPNHRGGIVNAYSTCGGPCGRPLNVSEVTAGHVLDQIGPRRDQLAVRAVPTVDIAGADPAQLEAWRVVRHAEISAELAGESRPQPTPIPAPHREELRFDIPLWLWCHSVTKLPKDR